MRKSTIKNLSPTLLFILNVFPFGLFSQIDTNAVFLFDTASVAPREVFEGKVEVTGSERIINLIDFYTSYTLEKPQVPGYRVEIFSESGSGSQSKAKNVQSKFQENFAHIPGYVKWQYPNFEVRVGDFRTKLEAEKNLQAIKEIFPFAYIKQDLIEPPALERQETEIDTED